MARVDNAHLRKRSWGTPQLKLYGSVQALTAGGTGVTNEATGGSTGTINLCKMGLIPPAMKMLKACN